MPELGRPWPEDFYSHPSEMNLHQAALRRAGLIEGDEYEDHCFVRTDGVRGVLIRHTREHGHWWSVRLLGVANG